MVGVLPVLAHVGNMALAMKGSAVRVVRAGLLRVVLVRELGPELSHTLAVSNIRPGNDGAFGGDRRLVVRSRRLCVLVRIRVSTPAVLLVTVQAPRLPFCRAHGSAEEGSAAPVLRNLRAALAVHPHNIGVAALLRVHEACVPLRSACGAARSVHLKVVST